MASDRLPGAVALITGGASGMGKAISEAFIREGARVVIGDISRAEDVARALGPNAQAHKVDVRNAADVEHLAELAVASFGRIDSVICCAGIDGDHALTADSTEENFARVIDVNLKGTYLTIRAALPRLKESGGGSIVTIASVAALFAAPTIATYAASKGGILALTRSVAAEYAADGIRANAICPGAIDTPMLRGARAGGEEMVDYMIQATPVGRIGLPSDIASLAVFLASAESSFITGASVVADGGFSIL